MNEEIWKPIERLHSRYEVSNIGRIRTVAKFTSGGLVRVTPTIRKFWAIRGYWQFAYSYKLPGWTYARRKAEMVHSLVLEAFVGPKPKNHIVNHKDANPKNNKVENLEWVTCLGNVQHCDCLGRRAVGERSGTAKLTIEQVLEIRRLAGTETQISMARRFGVSKFAIWAVIKRRNWAHRLSLTRL